MKWRKLKSKLVFNTKFFKVRKDKVRLPDGKILDWFFWDSPDSAMVIGITAEGKVVMNKQYRYLVGKEVVELSAGYLEKGESVEKAAKREFEEESGYRCKFLVKLGSVYETYGQLNRQIHIFFAKGLTKTNQNLEEHENIKVRLVSFKKAVKMVLQNKIPDMGSALAILLLKEKVEQGKIKLK